MRKLKEMTAADWSAVLVKAEQDVRDAEHAVARKKDAFDVAYFELAAVNDQTGMARHRKAIRDATDRLAEVLEANVRAQRALQERRQIGSSRSISNHAGAALK